MYLFFSVYEPPFKPPKTIIQVSLAKLGQKREEKLLPRIDAAPPPPAPKHTPAPPKPTTKKIAKAKPNTNPLDILKKRFGKPDFSGNPAGHARGSSINSELADSYELQVVELLRENYEIPRIISDREAKKLKLLVRLWIDAKGKLVKIKVQDPSRNGRFDEAVMQGSRRISSFGAPPLTMARKYKTDGLLIEFCPMECS
ncbi:MAG: TonB C-terminal domain-containing protein [Myxococcota bacterium]